MSLIAIPHLSKWPAGVPNPPMNGRACGTSSGQTCAGGAFCSSTAARQQDTHQGREEQDANSKREARIEHFLGGGECLNTLWDRIQAMPLAVDRKELLSLPVAYAILCHYARGARVELDDLYALDDLEVMHPEDPIQLWEVTRRGLSRLVDRITDQGIRALFIPTEELQPVPEYWTVEQKERQRQLSNKVQSMEPELGHLCSGHPMVRALHLEGGELPQRGSFRLYWSRDEDTEGTMGSAGVLQLVFPRLLGWKALPLSPDSYRAILHDWMCLLLRSFCWTGDALPVLDHLALTARHFGCDQARSRISSLLHSVEQLLERSRDGDELVLLSLIWCLSGKNPPWYANQEVEFGCQCREEQKDQLWELAHRLLLRWALQPIPQEVEESCFVHLSVADQDRAREQTAEAWWLVLGLALGPLWQKAIAHAWKEPSEESS